MGRYLKIVGLTLAALVVFYLFNDACVQFLKWYANLQLLPQLFMGFAFGGVSWLMGRGINYLFLYWSKQSLSSVTPGLAILSMYWFLHSLLIFSLLRGAYLELSWTAVSTLILTAELSVYPLVSAFYQSRTINRNGMAMVCPTKAAFADVTTAQ